MAELIFLHEWLIKCEAKQKNSTALSQKQYDEKVSLLKYFEDKPHLSKTSSQYRVIKDFVLVPGINGSYKLAKQNKSEEGAFLYVVPNEQLYETINKYHINGHTGISKMLHYMKNKFSNVTQEVLTHFVSYCEECNRKKNKISKKSIVVKPIRSNMVKERVQADLIDMQSDPDGEYKWILNIQDHFSKFVHLRPLKCKQAEAVASELLDIFLTTNGAPRILQCDNGREFDNKRIIELEAQWAGLKIVHSRPRHPQSQGSVERANAEVSKKLQSWRRAHGDSSNWSYGLKFVQFQINSTYHSGIEMTPCEAMYGTTAAVGLASSSLPPENLEVNGVLNEDDMDAMFSGEFSNNEPVEAISLDPSTVMDVPSQQSLGPSTASDVPSLQSLGPSTANDVPSLQQENTVHDIICSDEPVAGPSHDHGITADAISLEEDDVDDFTLNLNLSPAVEECYTGDCWVCSKVLEAFSISCDICKKAVHPGCETSGTCDRCWLANKRTLKRKHVEGAQEKSANKMLKQSEGHYPTIQVGDNVRVDVPKVDRGPADPPTLIGVVTELTAHGSFKIGTKQGKLKGCLARNMVEKCKRNVFVSLEDVPTTSELSVRQAVAAESIGSGQGFIHCNCKVGCLSGRCKCRKSNRVCNSRCHKNLSCQNIG